MNGFNSVVYCIAVALLGLMHVGCEKKPAVTFFLTQSAHSQGVGIEKKLGAFRGVSNEREVKITSVLEPGRLLLLGERPVYKCKDSIIDVESGRRIGITGADETYLYGGDKALLLVAHSGAGIRLCLVSAEDIKSDRLDVSKLNQVEILDFDKIRNSFSDYYLLGDDRIVCFGESLELRSLAGGVLKRFDKTTDAFWTFNPSVVVKMNGNLVWSTDVGESVVTLDLHAMRIEVVNETNCGILVDLPRAVYLLKHGKVGRRLSA